MDREELLGKYVAGERDFRGVILQYISLDGVKLEGVNFTGAIFNAVSFKTTLIDSEDISQGFNEPIFVNCNFSCSEWWVCRLPKLVGCNFQYSTMEGCYLFDRFVDCDWRYSQIKGCYWDDCIFEGCDFREMRLNQEFVLMPQILMPELYDFDPSFGIRYVNTFDKDGVFHSGIYCTIRSSRLPF
jgi:uncharacterized protein YjbI with pentapeptide repeats